MAVIRGIDNLLYYAVVDENGNRIEAGDLNVVGDTDFYEKAYYFRQTEIYRSKKLET